MLFNRDSRTEGPAVGCCIKDNGNYSPLLPTLIERVIYLPQHCDVENVEGWMREGYSSNAIVDPEFDMLILV